MCVYTLRASLPARRTGGGGAPDAKGYVPHAPEAWHPSSTIRATKSGRCDMWRTGGRAVFLKAGEIAKCWRNRAKKRLWLAIGRRPSPARAG